jgi:hypothetical protein
MILWRLRGISDDMAGKIRTGLGKPSSARMIFLRSEEEPSYKETKEREAGRVADGVVVLMTSSETREEGRTPGEE